MKGKKHIVVENRRIRYEFDIKRNITVIRGDSATGKTTLIDMLQNYQEQGESSGVTVRSECDIYILNAVVWKTQIEQRPGSIFFVDEGNHFVVTQEFAECVKTADAYFVLILRDAVSNLPYSVDEIYGIRTSSHYAGLKKTYNELYHLYGKNGISGDVQDGLLITEDSNSGYGFFSYCCKVDVKSACGKSNIKRLLRENSDKSVMVIADGAAFGSEIEAVMRIVQNGGRVQIYLPESFEWVVLSAGLLEDKEIEEILRKPEDYIDSQDYFSWERFFTKLLVEKSNDGYLKYQKERINPSYLHGKSREKIIAVLPEEIRRLLE